MKLTRVLVLGALAPVIGLISFTCPKPSRLAYDGLILVLTGSIAIAGISGIGRLRSRLPSFALTAAWIFLYQFVGAQMAWLLKPWVGHTFSDERFIPWRENLEGNFYESIFRILSKIF